MRSRLWRAICVPPGLSKKTAGRPRAGNCERIKDRSRGMCHSPRFCVYWNCTPHKGGNMFKRILLAVDGSEHGLRAAHTAGDLARTMRSEQLRIVVAYDPIPPYIGEPNLQHAIDARLNDSQVILRAALEAVGEIPGEIHTEM